MEFGVRELVQFGTLLASLAGAFAVVKSQLSRVIIDIRTVNRELHELNARLDSTELSPANLKDLNTSIAKLQTEMQAAQKGLDKLYSMHNGKHPPVN